MYRLVFDSSAELYLQGAGAGRPQHLGQLRGGGGVEGVHGHGVGHGDAGLHALMMGWTFVGLLAKDSISTCPNVVVCCLSSSS